MREGRPRRYALVPAVTFAHPDVSLASAALDELRARVSDQIVDLSPDMLRRRPEGTTLSIGALVVHLVWAEAGWIERITGLKAPADLREALDDVGSAVPNGTIAASDLNAEALVTLCHRIRDEFTVPALTPLTELDLPFESRWQPNTPRQVLMHLIWHWTYHSGHIGLLRDFSGAGYAWTFAATE